LAVIALLARGHPLLDDVPGVGKTIRRAPSPPRSTSSSAAVHAGPDALDITGNAIYNPKSGG
jgi:MoxR-like ATPase